jgi:hypothetical protein
MHQTQNYKKRKKRKKERKLQIRLSAELEKEQLFRKRKRTIFGPRKSKNFSQKKKKKLFTRTFLTFNLEKFPIRIFNGKTSFWWPHLFKQVVSFKGILNSGNI